MAGRAFGSSKDVALVVTTEGLLLAYEILPVTTSDKTTQGFPGCRSCCRAVA